MIQYYIMEIILVFGKGMMMKYYQLILLYADPNTFTMVVIINSFKCNTMLYINDTFIRICAPQRPIGVHVLKKVLIVLN